MAIDTQAQSYLERHRRIWQRKPSLRRIYKEEFFARLLSSRKPGGVSVEVGAGPGFLRQLVPEVISTDLVLCPWLDAVVNAQSLPFRAATVSNILGLDVLHHLQTPMDFLQEAERVLEPGGRLILVEPWVTPFSRFVYRYLHQEGCDLSAKPWQRNGLTPAKKKNAFDGNQAIPYLLFDSRNQSSTMAALPRLRVLKIERFSLFAYLFSFGFKPINLLPEFLYSTVATFERATLSLWRRFAAMRALIVLEKSA